MSAKSRGFPLLRKLSFAILAGVLALPATAQVSPEEPAPGEPGHKRALLAKFAGTFVVTQAQFGANVISETFENALKRSRDSARSTSRPIPDEIRDALVPFYPTEILENVRYTVGDTSPAGLAGFAIRNGKAAAVTLVDTIVFKDEGYVHNLALWSHEMHHIEQYKEWGVLGFAQRYVFGWQDVEAEAEAKARKFVTWYKARHN
jgi:hypothetical protein